MRRGYLNGFLCCFALLAAIPQDSPAEEEKEAGKPTRDWSTTATGISRALNPAISANGLFFGSYFSREPEVPGSGEHTHGPEGTGLGVQEFELQLTASIDPYTKADLIFALPAGESIELEEGIVTLTRVPGDFGGRFGKFYQKFGKHNLLHNHQFPLIDAPLAIVALLGDEGLNDVGVEANWFVPLSWYGELSAAVLDGTGSKPFGGTGKKDLAYLANLAQLWDLSESTTLEWGLSYAGGNNATGNLTHLAGSDLTIQWIPLRRATSRTLRWRSEIIYSSYDRDGNDVQERLGVYSMMNFKFARQWWIEGRYDWLESGFDYQALAEADPSMVMSGGPDDEAWRVSFLLAFVPSEFSALRLQTNFFEVEDEIEYEVFLQFNLTIGSHPAHRY